MEWRMRMWNKLYVSGEVVVVLGCLFVFSKMDFFKWVFYVGITFFVLKKKDVV